MTERPETAPMRFGDDWPGLFIRGDVALGWLTILRARVLARLDGDALARDVIAGMIAALEETRHPVQPERLQLLRPWAECRPGVQGHEPPDPVQ